jgi:hypothetical protein
MGESANHEKAIPEADVVHAELEVIERRLKTARKQFRRRVRQRAGALVVGGAAIGVLLIWASGHTRGFWSSLFNGVGAGFLTAAIVGAATAYIAGLWHAADEYSDKDVIWYLKNITDQISDLRAGARLPRSGRER